MYRYVLLSLILLLLGLVADAAVIRAQFDGPESAAYDAIRHRCLIDNVFSGSTVEIDSLGQTRDCHTGYGFYAGNHISGDSLYFAADSYYLVGTDMSTETTFMTKSIAAWNSLDGVCTDTSGKVYVVDTGCRMFKVALSDRSVEQLGMVPNATQDVTFDDAVHLSTYIFASGPPPEPMAAGDADCSKEVDIDDVVYLINYIFAGGNTPCDNDNNELLDC